MGWGQGDTERDAKDSAATWVRMRLTGSWGFPDSSVGKESSCNAGDPGSIPMSERYPGEGIGYPFQYSWASLVAQLERILLQCWRPGFHSWVGKISWRRQRLPTPVFWPREFHGLYSSWGHKALDTTELLSYSQSPARACHILICNK